MIHISGLVVCLLALTAEAHVGHSTGTWMYELICETDFYEVREYKSATWVTTSSLFIEDALQRLFGYFNGSNIHGTTFDITPPLIVTVPNNSSLEKTVYWSFLLPTVPFSPTPTDDLVSLTDTAPMTMFVLHSLPNNTDVNMTMYQSVLDAANYNREVHYAVYYNPLSSSWRDEVWFHIPRNPADTSGEWSSEEMPLLCP
ncbi:heme-binding protein 2-like [Solea solea]|uniref:heme-binding protein 2-like n=1 Tax=Solea solea TaxID=90069 RepID=UPI00272D4741|nr:heme-binding protein 2-like [Solea solea]